MPFPFIARHLQRWKRRPRFDTPGLGLALVLLLAATLLMLFTRGSLGPEAPPSPAPPVSRLQAGAPKPLPSPPAAPPREASPAPPPLPAPAETRKGCPQGCDVPPPDCVIKGNVARTGERIYHLPGQQFYGKTQITPGKGEAWFCTEEEARANGWRKAKV